MKLDGNCLNVWAWNVIEAISKCGLECLRTSFFHIPTNNPYPVTEASLSLPPPSGIQGPLACFANQLLSTTPNDARLRSTINGGEQACYSEAYDNGNPLRLNLCLQCDECYNAPKLVEVRGWIRHNSGIVCGIDHLRELISDVKVDYGVCGDV